MITDTGSRRAAVRQMAGNAAEARLARGERAAADGSDRLRNRALVALSGAVFLLLAHAFVPIDEFVHRGDDAYYYFKVAANYPRLGYWSFDGITPTNGVQPLWAAMLSGLALLLSWVGVTDLELLARFFVALAALLNYGASLLLFRLLAERVSIGTGIAVAGAFLFPLGITWSRVWGMENSLYALTLVGTICYFHLVFLARACWRTAVVLGILLALTALSRLNACLFIPCLLAYFLLRRHGYSLAARARLSVLAGVTAGALVLPYFAANYLTTGHLMPISGEVKSVAAARFLQEKGVDSVFSANFVALLAGDLRYPIRWFVTSRILDGLWVVGARVISDGAARLGATAAILAVVAVLPALVRGPRQWAAFLAGRLSRLASFAYLAAFAALNSAISVVAHPDQLSYALIRWWLVESEIVIVAVVATMATAALGYTIGPLMAERWQARVIPLLLALALAFHGVEMVQFYWNGTYDRRDWNASWNDESFRAARWMAVSLPRGAKIGSWNAGVVGYYTPQTVVNLDGVINNFDLLPYLERGAVHEYILRDRLTYLSDMDSMFEAHRLRERLHLTEVYSHYSPLLGQYYRIYRVDP